MRTYTVHAAIAQLVEHFHGKEGVSGSNPDRGSTLESSIKSRPEGRLSDIIPKPLVFSLKIC